MALSRYEITVRGIVQGVGFRPFVYRLATSLGLHGYVNNAASHVTIEIEGERPQLDAFVERLQSEKPPLSHITDVAIRELPCLGAQEFVITESDTASRTGNVYISPDIATCPDCRRELLDPGDRRYRYPFINCTNCGPRFTIITGVPYDRAVTTMRAFPMCPACEREYKDPVDRRYHAEPIACSVCGPQVSLAKRDGQPLAKGDEAISQAQALLQGGAVLAIKGLGGYHLACNALDGDAVRLLRRRKARDEKPFAVMTADVRVAERFCEISEAEHALLHSTASPIVLLRRKPGPPLPEEIAPGNPALGVMLPYTPLHLLLFHASPLEMLVMTSGNISGEPICYRDQDAFEQLGDIADYFLVHNREINTRVDDSVVRVLDGQDYLIRRSRGYVPFPVAVPGVGQRAVLACGGHLKNTFCLNKGENFYLSHHVGDLENFETLNAYERGIALFEQMLDITPDALAYDLHPNYLSTQYAMSRDLPRIGVQHHRAHIAACMADNHIDGEVIGVAFDGTGYGEDGKVWGGEFFAGDLAHLARVGHLEYVAIPGGDSAMAEPWKTALGYLAHAYGAETDVTNMLDGVPREKLALVSAMLAKGFNVYHTSSAGRLFDAAAALSGVRNMANYEGQAAIEFEHAAAGYESEATYPFAFSERDGVFTIAVAGIITGIVKDKADGVSPGRISATFHETVARFIVEGCLRTRERTGIRQVALSGGVFQNWTLLRRTLALLDTHGFTAYIHHRVPTNDGGLSLGQAVLALKALEKGE